MPTEQSLAKTKMIDDIRRLIDEVAGAETPWPELAVGLRKLTLQHLNALKYRIERSLAQAEEFGARSVTEEQP